MYKWGRGGYNQGIEAISRLSRAWVNNLAKEEIKILSYMIFSDSQWIVATLAFHLEPL